MFACARAVIGRLRHWPVSRIVIAGVGLVTVFGGVALAVVPTGLQNGSFESDLAGWNASIVRESVYGYPDRGPEPASCTTPNGICVIGEDHFTATSGNYGENPQEVTVSPLDGAKMVRLGGPFLNSNTRQPMDRYQLDQTFVVDAAHPVLALNYDVYTWDYTGFDDLFFRVTLTDENGNVITEQHQGSFGPGGDVSLKTTGWRPTRIDLTGYEGQQVHLKISSGGTSDNLFGFWSYIDAGLVPATPVGQPVPEPVQSPNGSTVPVGNYPDGNSGETWLTIPKSATSQFPNGCIPLTLNVPISPGNGTVSNAHLLFQPTNGGTQSIALTDSNHDNTWTATVPCVATGHLYVTYDLTEGGNTQSFSVPLGGLVLVDPAGVVYDKQKFDEAKAGGASEAEARAAAAISGADVRLQRCDTATGGCSNVLSGDPGIAPNVNPEVTAADGRYQWDVSSGFYRVVVTKAGYDIATGAILTVPPPVTDANIAMTKPAPPTSPPGNSAGDNSNKDGGGSVGAAPAPITPASPPATTAVTPATVKGCAALSGPKKAQCLKDKQIKAQLAKCAKLGGKKRSACRKRVLALAKCDKLKGKKRTTCRNRATSPGRKH